MSKIKFPQGVNKELLGVPKLSDVSEGQTFRCEITPELASKWLATNFDNRNPSNSGHKYLVRQIQDGKWKFNGESVKFDENGNLVDGQHRLMAVVEAKKSIDSNVSFGIPREAFHTMDTGKSRTPADILSAKGYKNANILSSVARQLLAIESNNKGLHENSIKSTRFDNADVMAFVHGKADLPEIVTEAHNMWQKMPIKIISSSVYCTMYYLFFKRHTGEARKFMESVALGMGLQPESPALALRQSLEKMYNERDKKKYSHYHKCTVFARCWNAQRKNEKMSRYQFRRTESMPKVI